ncbi:MAG: fructosamine kinase family protein [Pseudomonadota bacterium]
MPPDLLAAICRSLGKSASDIAVTRPISGGDINSAVELRLGERSVFVKYGGVDSDAFAAEAEGLQALAAADSGLVVPEPIAYGETGGCSFLVLEMLRLTPKSTRSDAELGVGLASLHEIRQRGFGWHRDNRIGATRQPNPQTEDWQTFFGEHRLAHQARLLGNRAVTDSVNRLRGGMSALFADFQAFPSLLHGDLWGGNYAACGERAAIFDPACYFGCRESDLAMTELFGGFGPAFYAAYEDRLPLDPGYPRRRGLYQLYHVLNHANLFGGAYVPQAQERLAGLIQSLDG